MKSTTNVRKAAKVCTSKSDRRVRIEIVFKRREKSN